MGTPDRKTALRERAAEKQRLIARKERQRRAFAILGVVVLAFGLLVALRLAGVGDKGSSKPTGSLDPAVLAKVTGVPASAFTSVGAGSSTNTFVALPGPDLTKDGKPRLVYIGAEYCPYCAAQRWAVVAALARFGTWSGLSETHSATDDVFPDTATFSFHGASYHSDYVTFEGVETESNQRLGGSYAPLDTLTSEQRDLLRKFDAPPYVEPRVAGAIPFLDLGNRYMVSGASFSPQLVNGHSLADIAGRLSDPSDSITKGVLGAANRITAAVCALTQNQPAAVCSSTAITSLEAELPHA